MVDENGIATLKADLTTSNPDAEQLLRKLGNSALSIPFYAIFPAGRPNEPIRLSGMYLGPNKILKALREAGPSLTETPVNREVVFGKQVPSQ